MMNLEDMLVNTDEKLPDDAKKAFRQVFSVVIYDFCNEHREEILRRVRAEIDRVSAEVDAKVAAQEEKDQTNPTLS